MTETKFKCGRTCAIVELCRFAPIMSATHTVHSHTTTVKVEVKDIPALGKSVEAAGGTVLGDGVHRLYGESVTGFGFKLPGWQYPVVLTPSGEFKFDNYQGQWGDEAKLDRVRRGYPIEVGKSFAEQQGWYSEMQGANLVVFHPSGGTLTVSPDAGVDANGFVGCGCEEAAGPLALALGKPVETAYKAEFFAERANVRVDGGES